MTDWRNLDWRNHFDRLGMPGIAGVGLLLFALAFAIGSVQPLRERLARLDAERQQLATTAVSSRASDTESEHTRDVLLPLSEAPGLLVKLDALATRHGVRVERTDYALKDSGRTLRLEVSMPLQAGYPALRAYLHDVLLMNAVALDELALQRALATDALVRAQVRLSYGLAPTP